MGPLFNFWQFLPIFQIMVQLMVGDKCISSYGFHSIVLKLCGALLFYINIAACAWIDGRITIWDIFEILK